MSATIPEILVLNKRRYAWRSKIERHKAELAGIPFHDRTGAPDVLVPIKKFAAELGSAFALSSAESSRLVRRLPRDP
jgi:hypothetical protein